jgi:pyruvate carboxylase
MGAIINGLAGTDADTGIQPEAILPLIAFWEQTRGLYQPFEADMRAGSTDVYLHEMPGGEQDCSERSCCPRCTM